MNDRYLDVLKQYDLNTDLVRKGRNGWICETSIGTVLLKEYRGTLKRLEFETQVLDQLNVETRIRVDSYLLTAEGNLAATAEDGTRYVLKHWFTDPECNVKDWREIEKAVCHIAYFHKALRRIPLCEEWNLGSILIESMDQEMERHNQELKRAKNYIRRKKKKTEFERCIMNRFSMFYDQAQEAWNGMQEIQKLGLEQRLCHGCLDHHHILFGTDSAAFIEFSKLHLGHQMTDLYYFMRKVMEKQEWNLELGSRMLERYDHILPLAQTDRWVLYYLFLYPEKYWKQINFYYNARKAWIPLRNMEKIRVLERQTADRLKFLELLACK